MGSYLKILLPESTTVKQMPGKTVSRSFCVCHVCWQAGWISWLMFCAWLCSATLAPYLEKAIPLSAIRINYCHRPAWLTAAPALAACRRCCCGVFFAGSSVASGFVCLTFLVTGDRVSLVSNTGESCPLAVGKLCLLGLCPPAGLPVTCCCFWADLFKLPLFR